MQKIDSQNGLLAAILQLENQRKDEEIRLKEEFMLAYEGMKPINLVMNTLKEFSGSSELKRSVLNTSIGLSVGLAAKFIAGGLLRSPAKQLLGSALMFGITNLVSKHPETIKAVGSGLLRLIRGKTGNRA